MNASLHYIPRRLITTLKDRNNWSMVEEVRNPKGRWYVTGRNESVQDGEKSVICLFEFSFPPYLFFGLRHALRLVLPTNRSFRFWAKSVYWHQRLWCRTPLSEYYTNLTSSSTIKTRGSCYPSSDYITSKPSTINHHPLVWQLECLYTEWTL